MKYDPGKHHRRSIRLKGYDYTQMGVYFITVVTKDREFLFGEVTDGETRLNDAGQAIERWWVELNRKFTMVETDEFVVMPNHFHGIIAIADVRVGADLRVGPASNRNGANGRAGAHIGAPLRASIPWIVHWFKTMTTNEYIRGVKQLGWTGFRGQLWQRNYYEHVIRTQESLDRIRQYIVENPAKWECDPENPTATIAEANDPWKSDER
jgi:REP element-mobilizing transposase RayT